MFVLGLFNPEVGSQQPGAPEEVTRTNVNGSQDAKGEGGSERRDVPFSVLLRAFKENIAQVYAGKGLL